MASDAAPKLDSQDVLNATVVERDDLNDYLSVVRIQRDDGLPAEFKPGQFATLGLPRAPNRREIELMRQYGKEAKTRLVRRAYSIASDPRERDHIELFVILVEQGKLTPQMWGMQRGARIWMSDEFKGEFTLDVVPPAKDLVMISTGTGLAPYISMYRAFRNTNRWRRFVVINGVRHVQDLGYRKELEQWAAEDPTLTYIPTVSRAAESDQWAGFHGRITPVLEADRYEQLVGAPLSPETCHVFLCGNPAMIDETEALLVTRGFTVHTHDQPGNVHFERYW